MKKKLNRKCVRCGEELEEMVYDYLGDNQKRFYMCDCEVKG